MKDPFQTEPTAYEVLGVGPGAGNAEIDAAFKSGLTKGGSVQKLTGAKLALQRPLDRTLIDVFLYDPQTIERLSPNPLAEPGALASENRAATAASWEQQLRSHFPDTGIAHSLAVMWYWQAVQQEKNGPARPATGQAAASGTAAGAPQAATAVGATAVAEVPAAQAALHILEVWRRAIACWAMVLASPDFWKQRPGLPEEIAVQAKTAISDRLQNQLHDLAQKRRDAGDDKGATRYQDLELALANELRAARQLASAGVRNKNGKVCCGPLMLEQMGVSNDVRGQLQAAAKSQPQNEAVKAALEALSPHAHIGLLIDQKKPQAALDIITTFGKKARGTPEIMALEARARHALGKQLADLGRLDEALDRWAKAIELASAALPDLVPLIREDVVSSCQARANALQFQNRDEAISLLGRAVTVVKDEKLQLLLAEMLTVRGIETINEAQRRIEAEKGTSPAILAELEKGLADFDRAQELGSKRAASSAETALKILEQARAGFFDLTGTAADLFKQANQAAESGNLDRAASLMRDALAQASPKSRTAVAKNLAICLNARAVRALNGAMEKISAAMEKHKPRVDSAVTSLLKRPWWKTFSVPNLYGQPDCSLCSGKASYSYDIPGHGEYTLCSSHADRLKTLMNSIPRLPKETVKQVDAAAADLDEAVKLDAGFEQAKTNRDQAKDLQKRIKESEALGLEGTAFDTFSAIVLNIWWLIATMSLLGSSNPQAQGLGTILAVTFLIVLVMAAFRAWFLK